MAQSCQCSRILDTSYQTDDRNNNKQIWDYVTVWLSQTSQTTVVAVAHNMKTVTQHIGGVSRFSLACLCANLRSLMHANTHDSRVSGVYCPLLFACSTDYRSGIFLFDSSYFCLSILGGRGQDGSPIIIFPEFPSFCELGDQEFRNVLTYLTSIPR